MAKTNATKLAEALNDAKVTNAQMEAILAILMNAGNADVKVAKTQATTKKTKDADKPKYERPITFTKEVVGKNLVFKFENKVFPKYWGAMNAIVKKASGTYDSETKMWTVKKSTGNKIIEDWIAYDA